MGEAPLRFGRIELRPRERRVFVDGQLQQLGARAYDMLMAMVERRDRVVTKRELLELVWPGMVVEENNLPVHVSALRKLLGGGAIATIPGRGYRFTLSPDGPPDPNTVDRRTELSTGEPTPADPKIGGASAHATTPTTGDRFDLPQDDEPIIGREEEVYGIVGVLLEHRLVTIVGAGGIGKTRLARAVLRRLRVDFVDGVWLVDLTAVHDGNQVAGAITQALGEPAADGDPASVLARALARRSHMLLVLDNCEQVAAGTAGVVALLLAELPRLRLLLTSRVPLHLAAEQVWRLEALPVPAIGATLAEARQCGAFELFEARARAGDQRFVLDHGALPQAIELCRRLEGHPLAIEMAAARAPQLGLAPLLDRLGERLRLLRARDPRQPARQLTLRALLDWSHSLLDSTQRVVMRRLSVFVGTFGLEAAQQVVAQGDIDEWAVLDALSELVDRSLVQMHADAGSSPVPATTAPGVAGPAIHDVAPGSWVPRYRMAETTRLYAFEQLSAANEAATTRARHRRALVHIADQTVRAAWTLRQAQLLAQYGPEQEDLQLAFDAACADAQVDDVACIGAALTALDAARAQPAGVRVRAAAARPCLAHATAARAAALLWNVVAHPWAMDRHPTQDLQHARSRVDAWRVAGDATQLYVALRDLAGCCAIHGQHDAAAAAAAELAALEDPDWPASWRIEGLQVQADLCPPGSYEAGRQGLMRALALAEQIGDSQRVAWLQLRLAELATAAGSPEEAIRLGRAAVQALEPLNRPLLLGCAWSNFSAAQIFVGDELAARQAVSEACALLRSGPTRATLFLALAALAAGCGRADEAITLLAHGEQLHCSPGLPCSVGVMARLKRHVIESIAAATGREAAPSIAELVGQSQPVRALDDAQAELLAWSIVGQQFTDAAGL
jgi:predicted ATPase/DNA-binding winged helix-turn-helix (wHTH) protein